MCNVTVQFFIQEMLKYIFIDIKNIDNAYIQM